MSALTMAGPYVAAGVALAVAVYSDVNRRIDKESSTKADARNIVVVSWPQPIVTNASAKPIRDVAMIGADRFVTKRGTYIDWHCEAAIITGLFPAVALLMPTESHQFVDGDWVLSDQAGNMFGGPWKQDLDHNARAVAAQVEWTDSRGHHWRRVGTQEPQKTRTRTAAGTYPANNSS